MPERHPDDATLLTLERDATTGVPYIATGQSHHLLDAYHDPRPRIPSWGSTIEELASVSHEEQEELAVQARELRDQVDFKKLLQESDDTPETTAVLTAELTADRVVEKLETETND